MNSKLSRINIHQDFPWNLFSNKAFTSNLISSTPPSMCPFLWITLIWLFLHVKFRSAWKKSSVWVSLYEWVVMLRWKRSNIEAAKAANSSNSLRYFTIELIFKSITPKTSLFHHLSYSLINLTLSLRIKTFLPRNVKDFHDLTMKVINSLCSNEKLLTLNDFSPQLRY